MTSQLIDETVEKALEILDAVPLSLEQQTRYDESVQLYSGHRATEEALIASAKASLAAIARINEQLDKDLADYGVQVETLYNTYKNSSDPAFSELSRDAKRKHVDFFFRTRSDRNRVFGYEGL